MHARHRVAVFLVTLVAGARLVSGTAAQEELSPSDNQQLIADITAKENELAHIAEKVRALKEARVKKTGEQTRLTDAVEVLEDRVQESRLELDRTNVSSEEVQLRVRQTRETLEQLQRKQLRVRTQLKGILRVIAVLDRSSPLEMLVLRGSFADFLGNQAALARVQARATALLLQTDALHTEQQARQRDLADREEELEQLAKLQTAQRVSLESAEQQKRNALSQTVREAARLASLLAEAEEARREIQEQVYVLKNAGVRLSLKQAEDFARYAGNATGVRPALLLGVLKVESNVGTNVGSGRYPDDVHPAHREAFLRVMDRLGLDPATTPVSAKPQTYQGWGGALGPGQIMPGIWERVEPEVSRLVGKARPSPFALLDAFVATAVILQNAGAASGNEYAAVNRYFAGPNWQNFTWYGDRVLAVAKQYEGQGL